MIQKKWVIGMSSVLLVALVLAGYFAVAANIAGSADDPLVTISYIEDELASNLLKKVEGNLDAKVKKFEKDIDTKFMQASADIDDKIKNFETKYKEDKVSDELVSLIADAVIEKTGGSTTGSASGFALVTVPAGKTLVGDAGCEIILRVGTGVCVAAASPGFIDLTTGEVLENSKQLVKNHYYVSTLADRGVKASNEVKILVRGSYKIT